MPKRVVAVAKQHQSLLELVSHGRKGPSGDIRLSPAQLEAVARTVRRAPEVIVKVSGGARDAGGAKAHFDYIDRHGKLEVHTDDGRELLGKDAAAELVDDWNLAVQARPRAGLDSGGAAECGADDGSDGPGRHKRLVPRARLECRRSQCRDRTFGAVLLAIVSIECSQRDDAEARQRRRVSR